MEKIVESKKGEINTSREYVKKLEEMALQRGPTLPFEKALSSCKTRIIAEVKRSSPSQGDIREVSASVQAELYQKAGAVAVSVLTDMRFFKGSLQDLVEVREKVSLPILRKDFILHPVQVLEAKAYGADVVLLIVRVLEQKLLQELLHYAQELGLYHIVEVFSLEEAERALQAGARVVGINNRDLDSMQVDLSLSERLAPQIKAMGAKFVVAESGIESREQVLRLENLGVDAFLVGTSLMKSPDPAKKLKELLGYNY